MDTASHNIANVSTLGYTRQRVDLVSRQPRTSPHGYIGTGVDVQDITRLRDAFLDAKLRAGTAMLGSLQTRTDLLTQAEALLAEPDQGLSVELTGLFNAFEDLALNPPDAGARQLVLDRLDGVAGRISGIAASWIELGRSATTGLVSTVEQANQLLAEVGTLNQAILEAGALGGVPNDLLDQRDLVVDKLSTLIGASAADAGDGSIRVSLHGMSLVSGNQISPLTVDVVTLKVMHPSGVAVQADGEAGGYQQFLLNDLPTYQSSLDQLAIDLSGALNALHATGFWSPADQGGDLLTYNPGFPALSLKRAIDDPNKLAVATTGGPPFPIYDGGIAQQLAGLRSVKIAGGGTATAADAIRSVVTRLGQAVSSARTGAQTQSGLVASADLSRRGAHEVSLDEEMVSLMQLQRMYEAAAKVISAIDEALDTLINRVGR
jgi:flagellar hook-associated protein 1 FlgK